MNQVLALEAINPDVSYVLDMSGFFCYEFNRGNCMCNEGENGEGKRWRAAVR